MRIVLLGPPGAGKGTQAAKVCEKFQLPHLSTGMIFREAVNAGSELGKAVKAVLDEGKLVSDELVLQVVFSALLEGTTVRQSFLLDGFPRTVIQAERLDEFLSARSCNLTHVVYFDVPEDILVGRVQKRSLEEGRSDDAVEVFRKRLEVYRNETEPLVEYYSKKGLVQTISGLGEIDEVFLRVQNVLL